MMRVISAFDRFFRAEAAGGVVLAFCAVVAMVVANSSLSSVYFDFLHFYVLGLSVEHWINDGLMAIFFFVVGLEIKREVVVGELRSFERALLPIAGALGGMIVPAIIYFVFNRDGDGVNGWAIPMATDIAFAVGVLSLFGARVPLALKVFLLTLAIVDDLGAIVVIATFYTEQIRFVGLLVAGGAVGLILLAQRMAIRSYGIYTLIGVVLWWGVLYSGIHATIAGVILGFLTPFEFAEDKGSATTYSPLDFLIHKIHLWVAFAIMPIFALANAGIPVELSQTLALIQDPVAQGIFWGLVAGKPVGVFLATLIVTRFGVALPTQVTWAQLFAVSCLAGIGFTMSIFIANLSFASTTVLLNAKTATLIASVAAGFVGFVMLGILLPKSKIH